MKNLLYLSTFLFLLAACSAANTGSTANSNTDRKEDISLDLTQRIKMLSGVRVTGDRGNAEIFVGGPNSMNGSNYPLFVLDGRPMSSYASMYSIVNTADIKRVELLRNPVDLAFYGSRGANGVIKVTTDSD